MQGICVFGYTSCHFCHLLTADSYAQFRCYLHRRNVRALIPWPGETEPKAGKTPATVSQVSPIPSWLISAAGRTIITALVVAAGRPLYTFNLCFVIYINRASQPRQSPTPGCCF